ncbi:MAG: SIR2 family NAD-dependent protein deacylase [Desulfovibrionales bacterium]
MHGKAHAPWYEACTKAARHLHAANRTVALTGAGISVASGIPDFRSPGGLWAKYDPEQVCSTWALMHNPKGVWEFLLDALEVMQKARPNSGHQALARLEQGGKIQAVITQNIDNLHQEGGSREVVEFHGNCKRLFCTRCRQEFAPESASALTQETIPWLCDCGGLVRPDVVFFGEPIPHSALIQSQELIQLADCIVIIGTSGDVAPANSFPYMVKSRGGTVLEINLGHTGYDRIVDVRIDGRAEDVLPVLADLVLQDARH